MSNILVKVSGSLVKNQGFYDWLKSVHTSCDKWFILCGGGEQISKALKEKGISSVFRSQGREIESREGRWLARGVLMGERDHIEFMLDRLDIDVAEVLMPFKESGGDVFHMNADKYALALSPGFDKVYIVAKKEGRSKYFPKKLKKIEVVYI
jgi:hypothetical protein